MADALEQAWLDQEPVATALPERPDAPARSAVPSLEAFVAAALSGRVASFDVFDTAIFRRVAQPTHVFALVERTLGRDLGPSTARGFAQGRIEAERFARDAGRRHHGHVEVTTDEIFAALPRFWPGSRAAVERARALEGEAELALVEPEPAVLDAYARIKAAGGRTVFVSDVYLSEGDVRALLVRCGYGADDPLFVSSAHRLAKWDGSIWPLVAERLGVGPGDIVHLGDNSRVDVEAARKAGVDGRFWPGRSRHHKPFAPVSAAIAPVSRLKASLQTPAHAGPDTPERAWAALGSACATVVYGAFLNWIAERVRHGVDHVYFCARDGQIGLKLWRSLIAPREAVPPASYLAVSRRTLQLPRLDRPNEATAEFLLSGLERRSVRTYLARADLAEAPGPVALAISLFGSLDRVVKTPADFERLRELFERSRADLARTAARHRALAERYLAQEGVFAGGHRVMIDLGWRGSLQASLQASLKRAGASTVLSGLYCGLTREAAANRGAAGWMEAMIANDFMDAATDFQLRQMVTILEGLHAADHGTVWSYEERDGRLAPVFGSNAREEDQFERRIGPVQRAAASVLGRIFEGCHEVSRDELTPESAWAALSDLCLYPSRDEAELLGALRHWDGFEHAGDGIPLATPLEGLPPEGVEAALSRHSWIAGSLKLWTGDDPSRRTAAAALARRLSGDEAWSAQFLHDA